MIAIYPDNKYEGGIIDLSQRIQPGLLYHAATLEDAVNHIKSEKELIIDYRYLIDKLDKEVNYVDSDEIKLIFNYLDPIDSVFKSESDLLYYFIMPDSKVNIARYIVSSVISNLNLFHRMKFKDNMDGTYKRGNNKIKYKFNVFGDNLVQEIKKKTKYDGQLQRKTH